jgi:hypothetical protein
MAGRKKTPSNSNARKTAAKTLTPKNQTYCRMPVREIAGGMILVPDTVYPAGISAEASQERLGRFLKT